MKIGVFGGTFNPPHEGHLRLAQAALEAIGLDLVIWVPNAVNPFKVNQETVDGDVRLRMVQAMIGHEDKMAVSDIELTREGPSYTYETLEELQAAQPGADLWLLLGADNLENFMSWHFPERILKVARLAVAVRPGDDPETWRERQAEPVQRRIDLIEMEPVAYSSTAFRDMIARDRWPAEGLHPAVIELIREHGLYRKAENSNPVL